MISNNFTRTISKSNNFNLAPFSYFNGVCSKPPTIVFCPARRGWDGAEKDTLINIRETEVDLEPSGRQIDTSFAYTKDISEDLTLSFKTTITDEYNHIKDNDKHYSGYIGLNFENLKIGISDATNISRPSVQLKYRKEF